MFLASEEAAGFVIPAHTAYHAVHRRGQVRRGETVLVLGAAGGAIRTVSATLLPEWFGTTHLGSIQGTLTLLNVGASALGPVTLAVLQERTDSYPTAIMLLSIIPLTAMVFALLPPFPARVPSATAD